MIPIHELMIGSLFLYPDKEVWQKVHCIDKYNGVNAEKVGDSTVSCLHYKMMPIRITEVHLFDLFDEEELGYYSIDETLSINVDGQVYLYESSNRIWLCEVHYLHKLQMLYQSLTGNKLEVKI